MYVFYRMGFKLNLYLQKGTTNNIEKDDLIRRELSLFIAFQYTKKSAVNFISKPPFKHNLGQR
jgi:hypothetical protein